MSSFEPARLAGAMALALSVTGCFQPLYGQASHPGLVEDMRAIEMAKSLADEMELRIAAALAEKQGS
jgi:hypothetical protein